MNTITMVGHIEDEKLGRLILRTNARAIRLIFRAKSDGIYVSVPLGVTLEDVKEAIEEMRDQLLAMQQKVPRVQIDLNYRIDTAHFKLSLALGKQDRFLARPRPDGMEIVCPPETEFNNENLQVWLRKAIEEALRKNAKAVLPSRLAELSAQHRLPFQAVKINSSRGRWGSCSVRQVINLSFFVLLLPQHLIDYVLLHELCHTLEMNHSDRFWSLLNSFTGGKAIALREELDEYTTSIG
jgi:predicted metal-dependent hydrolase